MNMRVHVAAVALALGVATRCSGCATPPELRAPLATNLPHSDTGTATKDTNHRGGIFEIKRMTYDDAAFVFFGPNPDLGPQTPELITVRLGDNEDMRTGVVRRMIPIIREYTKTDFIWRSTRLDGGVMLSARPADSAALEVFLLSEFFNERSDPR